MWNLILIFASIIKIAVYETFIVCTVDTSDVGKWEC